MVRERLNSWLKYSVRRRLLDEDLESIKEHLRGRVLEIGNGRTGRRGRFQPPFENAESWTYLDLDLGRLPHIRAMAEQLPLRDAAFDTVLCLEVLEYVTYPLAALQEIRRVLNCGGKLILATPFLHRADAPHDYWRFTEHGLCFLLKETGFDIEWLKPQGSALGVAVNILKYSIGVQPATWWRTMLACITLPALLLLCRLDGRAARSQPLLRTFSTGYLVLAMRPEAD